MRRKVDLNVGWAEGDGERVVIGDRLVHREIRVYFPGQEGQPNLGMVIDSSTGVPRCVRLEVVSTDDGREVRSTDVRAVKIDDWLEAIVPLFADEITERGEDGSVAAVVRVADSDADYTKAAKRTLQAARRASRRRVTPELLARVAEVYRSHVDRPAEAVELAFGVSERTAFRYIQEARRQGLLEERSS